MAFRQADFRFCGIDGLLPCFRKIMFDSVVLSQILKEMALPGSHVNKITQPGRDVLYFSLYGAQGAQRLLISANASAPRLQYTSAVRENPDVPPNFFTISILPPVVNVLSTGSPSASSCLSGPLFYHHRYPGL